MDDSAKSKNSASEIMSALRDDGLKKLEWFRLTDELSKGAAFSSTQQRLRELRPWHVGADRSWWFQATAEMLILLASSNPIALTALDVAECLPAARRGGMISAPGLFQLLQLVRLMGQASTFSGAELKRNPPTAYPLVSSFLSAIVPLTTLERALTRSVDEDGKILSTASPALHAARQKLQSAQARIQRNLEDMLRKSEVRDAVQDPVWVVREGRYVLPVRSDRRGDIKGTPRGISASGSTIFVEPVVLEQSHAQIEEAEVEVQQAEFAVLTELSDAAHQNAEALFSGYSLLARYDELVARARFAAAIRGICPEFKRKSRDVAAFTIINAKHPLFFFEKKNCIPNDLALERKTFESAYPSVWVLSGPNAGGKTVAMRTVGIMALMANAGLFVSAVAASLHEFDNVFVELGDRQSRQDDLSSFSGHLQQMKRILDNVSDNTLVLIDEGFVGTDPVVGMALARATLEDLANRGATVIVTTHFSNLKLLADSDSRFQNGSMEFESGKLAPTYRLLNGVPGQSYAIELATRLGFDAQVLASAREYQGAESQRLEALLADLQEKRRALEGELTEQTEVRKQLVEELAVFNSEVDTFRTSRRELFEQYNVRIQKRMNIFENRLTIRERQYERRRMRMLREQAAAAMVSAPEGTVVDSSTAQNVAQPPLVKKEKKRHAPLRMSGFEDLKNLRLSKKGPSQQQQARAPSTEPAGPQRPPPTKEELIERTKGSTEKVTRKLESLESRFKAETVELEQHLSRLGVKADLISDAYDEHKNKNAAHPPEFWKEGMAVRIPTMKQAGKVLRTANKQGLVDCQFGLIKTRVPHTELMTLEEFARGRK